MFNWRTRTQLPLSELPLLSHTECVLAIGRVDVKRKVEWGMLQASKNVASICIVKILKSNYCELMSVQ